MKHVEARSKRRDIWAKISVLNIDPGLERLIRQLELLPPFDNFDLHQCRAADNAEIRRVLE